MRVVEKEQIRKMLPVITEDMHKFSRGRLLICAGSYGMAGACIMAARAALRSGVGYLDLLIPESIYPLVSPAVPEAICTLYDETEPFSYEETFKNAILKADAVAFGSGIGSKAELLSQVVFPYCEKKLIIDADGLKAFKANWSLIPETADVVMTPHEGEMARLLQMTREEIHEQREEITAGASEFFSMTVLLKGPGTLIQAPGEEMYKNPTGGPGLSRAGSGDTLTGIIGSLMAQGQSAFDAAVCGAYIHGAAGDLLEKRIGLRSMLPTDIPGILPEIFRGLEAISE